MDTAVGAMIAAQSAGINIPFELGIAGFANEPFTEFVTPCFNKRRSGQHKYGACNSPVIP